MAITYPLSMPSTPGAKTVRLTMRNVVGISESPTTLAQQVLDWNADAWLLEVVLPRLATRALAEPWIAFLAALRGPVGTFLAGDPNGKTPRGSWAGTPVCDGAAAARVTTLNLKGFTSSATGVIKPGDYFHIGSGTSQRLYKVVTQSDLNADSSGKVTVDIWPTLRAPTSDGLAVTKTNAQGLFRLVDVDRAIDLDEILQYPSLSFKAREAL